MNLPIKTILKMKRKKKVATIFRPGKAVFLFVIIGNVLPSCVISQSEESHQNDGAVDYPSSSDTGKRT